MCDTTAIIVLYRSAWMLMYLVCGILSRALSLNRTAVQTTPYLILCIVYCVQEERQRAGDGGRSTTLCIMQKSIMNSPSKHNKDVRFSNYYLPYSVVQGHRGLGGPGHYCTTQLKKLSIYPAIVRYRTIWVPKIVRYRTFPG